MNTRFFISKSLIALGAVAVLSASAVAGPRATGHVKPFDGRTGTTSHARSTAFANPVTPTGYKTVPLYGRKTGSDKSQD